MHIHIINKLAKVDKKIFQNKCQTESMFLGLDPKSGRLHIQSYFQTKIHPLEW